MKNTLIVIGCIAGLLALVFLLELFGLGMFGFFEPKKENIRREVFENTKSFTHGKTQQLAKYFEEHHKADSDSKEAIRQLVKMNFADFPSENIRVDALRSFLIQMRGY